VAHNTDVPALAECVKRGAPRAHGDAIVLGNGGAALAAVVACKNSGSEKVWVSARSWQSSLPKAEWRDVGEFRALGAEPFTWDKPWELAPFAAARCVVQATSAGMRGKGGGQELAAWLPWSELPRDCFVYDVVYNPPSTPLLERARKDGLPCEGGLSMLVGQAALAVRLWLGIEAPRQAMQELAARLLAEQNP
jgi:shikimate 5-dehydrogenase